MFVNKYDIFNDNYDLPYLSHCDYLSLSPGSGASQATGSTRNEKRGMPGFPAIFAKSPRAGLE